jgi:hypothetical protein
MTRLNIKLESYYQQDKLKGRLHKVYYHGLELENLNLSFPMEQNINISELLELIHKYGLICYLCNQTVHICTTGRLNSLRLPSYDNKQFTLDRLDNLRNHSKDNVMICCLTCNKLRSNNYTAEQFKNTFF